MSNKLTATFLTAIAMAAVPMAIAPVATAEVCGEAGRYVRVGGCTNIVGDAVDVGVAGAAIAGATALNRWGYPPNYAVSEFPAFPGEAPCFAPNGLPYYTPANMPCY